MNRNGEAAATEDFTYQEDGTRAAVTPGGLVGDQISMFVDDSSGSQYQALYPIKVLGHPDQAGVWGAEGE